MSKAGAVLVALLTTGMGGGDVKINDLWIFVSRMSASLKTLSVREGANKQVISSQADSLIKISRIWADFFPANTSNQPI